MDKQLAEDFDSHLKNVMLYLSQKQQTQENDVLRAASVLDAKKALYDICFDKANEYLGHTDQQASDIYT